MTSIVLCSFLLKLSDENSIFKEKRNIQNTQDLNLDNEPDISYTLSANAVNPAGNLKKAYWLTSDNKCIG